MKIRLALSKYWSNQTNKISQDRKDIWAEFNGSFENKEIDPILFPVLIQKGHAYTAQHTNYRKKENFICSQFLALDFDTEDNRSSFETLCQNEFINEYGYFLHTTPSHTESKPRTRVVFILDTCVDDPKLYGEMSAALVDYFELSDSSCKDPARFFYGNKDCDIHKLGNVLPLAIFNRLILEPYQEKERVRITALLKQKSNIKVTNHVPDRLLQIHRAKLLNHISTAVDGKKHITILTICKTLGGYVAGGYYDFNEMLEYCKNAIVANPHNVKDLNHAFATIETALQYGMDQPLYFEDRGYSDHINAIEPALSDIQKRQVHVVVGQAIDETKSLSKEAIEAWERLGFLGQIVDMYDLGYQGQEVDKSTGEVLQDETFVVPFRDGDKTVLNIEYRFNNSYGYDNDMPFLFTTDNTRSDCQMVVLPDSLTALDAWLKLGECDYNFVGLPHMPILKETIDYDGAVVLLEPETDYNEYGLKVGRGHCRFVRLPLSFEDMLTNGLNKGLLSEYIKMSKKV